MNTHIQIRNVDKALHRKLKMRAADRDMTLTDYVKRLIELDLSIPSMKEMAERLRKLPPVVTTTETAEIIRQDRDSR